MKMRRIVEYPFRRRTSVRQKRISARGKVKYNKIKGKPRGFPSSNLESILVKIQIFIDLLVYKNTLFFTFPVCTFSAYHHQ